MKKLVLVVLVLSVPFTWTCGSDEVARALKCDDVCNKFANDCLGALPEQTREQLEANCLNNCKADATREQLDCFDSHSCAEIIRGDCWDL